MTAGNVLDRLLAKAVRDPDTDCWCWTAHTADGYGRIQVDGRSRLAYGVAYEILVGATPVGLELDHHCRLRACINPAHLRPVTKRENILTGVGMGARYAARTHCPKGHPFAGDNLIMSRGQRICRVCHLARGRAYYAANRARYVAYRKQATP